MLIHRTRHHMISKQEQKSGDNSTNIQARDVSIGISYADAKLIALDVFEANFLKLSEEAYKVGHERANNFTDAFLKNLSERNPQAIASTSDPDMQYALFTAQREYARSGDKELSDVLVDILVDRASHSERSLIQIVLNESLTTAPKLTVGQFDVLSLVFILKRIRRTYIGNLSEFAQHYLSSLVPFITPFIQELKNNSSIFPHLEYAGCGTVQISSIGIGDIFRQTYPGLFSKGMDKAKVDELLMQGDLTQEFIGICQHDNNLFQINALDKDTIEVECRKAGFDDAKTEKISDLQDQYLMSSEEIETYIESALPALVPLLDAWHNSPLRSFNLTSVGIAIAHANIRRKTQANYDLSIWIK